MPWRFLRMEEHFELIKANFIRCEECNENFFFDFLRHPRYFVSHFKTCHLKNLLYRFNGYSEEENQKTRFGPRRKRDANAWFGQLKSTEKRMISMQDNKWSEITESECWSCRLCNDGKADLTHVFELNELGRGQAFLHLRQFHEAAYEVFLRSLPDVQNSSMLGLSDGTMATTPNSSTMTTPMAPPVATSRSVSQPMVNRSLQQRIAEAERSRLRRMRASVEERQTEAQRSKRRRDSLTPVQRQADYDRRKRKKKRVEESARSKKRREDATDETKQKEVLRSRERRRNATEEQRQREALRSRLRRQNASDEQKNKERERCRKRYECKKASKPHGDGGDHGGGDHGGSCGSSVSGTDDGGDSSHFSDASAYASMAAADSHFFAHSNHHQTLPHQQLGRTGGVHAAATANFMAISSQPTQMNQPMMMQQQQHHQHHHHQASMPTHQPYAMGTMPMVPSSMLLPQQDTLGMASQGGAMASNQLQQTPWSSMLHGAFLG